MNWGKGIILVFVAFVSIMGVMVTICVRQDDIHLVTPNYYEEEIRYQEQIDRMVNASGLEQDALVFDADTRVIDLNLPVGAKGELHLFRPSDARLDKKLEIDIIDAAANSVDVGHLKPGYWRVKLTWTKEGVAYFQEKKINL